MKDVLEDVQAWVDRGDRVAIATVVGVKRSAPRAPGAKMAVNEHGEVSRARSRADASRAPSWRPRPRCCAARGRSFSTSGSPTARPGMLDFRAEGR